MIWLKKLIYCIDILFCGSWVQVPYFSYIRNFYCFSLRQFLILLAFVLILIFKEESEDWTNESLFIDKTLIDKFPLLKLEPFFIVIFSISSGLIYYDLPAIKSFSYILVTICYISFLFWCFKAYCIFKTPVIYTKYIKGKAGIMGGLRFLTFIATKFAPLASGLKYVAYAGGMAIAGEAVYTKTVHSMNRRCFLDNLISLPAHGMVAKYEHEYSAANYLLDTWPDKAKVYDIVKEYGVTIDMEKVSLKLAEYNTTYYYQVGKDKAKEVTLRNFSKMYPGTRKS